MKASQAADAETMRNAARLNWRLWTILQSELLDPACPVPLDIRNSMLSLARFVDGEMVGFLAEPEAAKLDVLIEINRELAAGLNADPSRAAGTPAAAPVAPEAPRRRTRLSI